MSSKYVDLTAIMQVIGCVFNNPSILSHDDKYKIYEEDFPDNFHKIICGSIYKLYESGSDKITLNNIIDYLAGRPKSASIFNKQKGDEWLLKVSANANESTFDYYYNRLKKMTLLRAYDNYGIDVSDIYDPDNILDVKKKQMQEDMLDNLTILNMYTTFSQRSQVASVICALISYQYNPILVMYQVCAIKVAAYLMMATPQKQELFQELRFTKQALTCH